MERTGGNGDTEIDIVIAVTRHGVPVKRSPVTSRHPRRTCRRPTSRSTGNVRDLASARARTRDRGGGKSGDTIKLGQGHPAAQRRGVTVPFAVPLPADAPPTSEAVHSSLEWFLEATLTYSDCTSASIEHVRRPIVVVNAP